MWAVWALQRGCVGILDTFHRSSCSSGGRREGHYCFQYVCVRHTPCSVPCTLFRYIRRILTTCYSSSPLLRQMVLQASIHPFLPASSLSQIRRNQNKQTAFDDSLSFPRLVVFLLVFFSFSPPHPPPPHHPYFLCIKEAFRRQANMRSGPFFKIVPRARRCACLKLASHWYKHSVLFTLIYARVVFPPFVVHIDLI